MAILAVKWNCRCVKNVTGSGKRYIVAHTMIFLYKRCCSKTCNIVYSLKRIFFGLGNYLPTFTPNLKLNRPESVSLARQLKIFFGLR